MRDPKSVAEHSLRVAQLAALIASEEGGDDPARAAYLGLWRDSQETRIGDLHTARGCTSKLRATCGSQRTKPLFFPATLPRASGMLSPSSKQARPAAPRTHLLECLMQAVKYGESGYKRVDRWIESSRCPSPTPSTAA